MPWITNVSQRLINTHDMTPLPPGVPTEISAEAANHDSIAQAIADGHLQTMDPVDYARKQAEMAEKGETEKKPDQPSPTFNTGTEQQDKSKTTAQQPTQQQPTQQQPIQQPPRPQQSTQSNPNKS